MGGITIANIIQESRQVADLLNRVILQPMSSKSELRKYLLSVGYKIIDEDVAREDDNYYEVIVAKKADYAYFDKTDILVGPVLRYKKTPVILDYIKLRIQKLENIVEILKRSNTEASRKAIFKCQDRLKVLMEVIK